MVIREVLLFLGLEFRTELLLDSAAARGICRREGVGTIRHLSTKVLWPQLLVKRGEVTFGACRSAENRADFFFGGGGGGWTEVKNSVNGDREDGQDENEQQGAAVQR